MLYKRKHLSLVAWIALLIFMLSACNILKEKDVEDADKNEEDQQEEITPDQTEDGTLSATLDPSSDKTQIIKAPEGSAGGKSYVAFLPGSLATQTDISLGFLPLESNEIGDAKPTDYGIEDSIELSAAGPEFQVLGTNTLELAGEFEIAIELDEDQVQSLRRGHLAIFYQIMKLRRNQLYYGVIAPDSITLQENIATFKASYFGIYRPGYTNPAITNSLEKASPWSDFATDNFDREDTTFDSDLDYQGTNFDSAAFLGSDWKALTNYDSYIENASINISEKKVKCVGACIAEFQKSEPSSTGRFRMGITFNANSYGISSENFGTIGVMDAADEGCPAYAGFFCNTTEDCKIGILDKGNSTPGGEIEYFGTARPIRPQAKRDYMIELERDGTNIKARLKTGAGLTIQTIKGQLSAECTIQEPAFSFGGFINVDEMAEAHFDNFYLKTAE